MYKFRFFNVLRLRLPLSRNVFSQQSLIDISIDKEGIGLLSLKRLPVNSISFEVFQDLSKTLDVVRENRCKGLVITSAAKVFSAGIDLNELNNPGLSRLRAFWSTIQDVFMKLYGAGDITSAVAINGYTAAGGCVISLLCDYRVMVSGDTKAKIGLNDTMVGIVPRPWLCDIINRNMGYRQAEIALTASTMFTAEEALKVNLIDEIATDKSDAIEKCKQFIRRYDNIPNKIRAETKRSLRKNIIKQVEMNREDDIEQFLKSILDPFVQE